MPTQGKQVDIAAPANSQCVDIQKRSASSMQIARREPVIQTMKCNYSNIFDSLGLFQCYSDFSVWFYKLGKLFQ